MKIDKQLKRRLSIDSILVRYAGESRRIIFGDY